MDINRGRISASVLFYRTLDLVFKYPLYLPIIHDKNQTDHHPCHIIIVNYVFHL
jgi:hypothetical protein